MSTATVAPSWAWAFCQPQHCGQQSPQGCWCDVACEFYNDCCSNYLTQCYTPWVSPSLLQVPTTGGTITVLGGNFGQQVGPAKVTVGGALCAASSWSSEQIVCQVAPGAGGGAREIRVTNQHGLEGGGGWVQFAPPTLTGLSPVLLAVAGGTELTLSGQNFGPAGTASVTVGGAPCPVVGTHTHTQIRCWSPPGAGAAIPVRVDVAGQLSPPMTLGYAPPILHSLSPAEGPASGGTPLTLSGAHFGSLGQAAVTIGGAPCPITEQSQTTIACTTGPAAEGPAPVQVVVAAQASAPQSFLYLAPPSAPSLSALSPSFGPTTGGTPITLTGANLASPDTIVTIGASLCPVVEESGSQLTCVSPAGVGAHHPVVVTANGQASDPLSYSYLPPYITGVQASAAPTKGGQPITITGANFGAQGAQARVGGAPCPVLQQHHTSLVCALPPGAGTNVPVEVEVGGQSSGAPSNDAPLGKVLVASTQATSAGVVVDPTPAEGEVALTVSFAQPSTIHDITVLVGLDAAHPAQASPLSLELALDSGGTELVELPPLALNGVATVPVGQSGVVALVLRGQRPLALDSVRFCPDGAQP